eukprot:2348349-Rhodomonas_salina.8
MVQLAERAERLEARGEWPPPPPKWQTQLKMKLRVAQEGRYWEKSGPGNTGPLGIERSKLRNSFLCGTYNTSLGFGEVCGMLGVQEVRWCRVQGQAFGSPGAHLGQRMRPGLIMLEMLTVK